MSTIQIYHLSLTGFDDLNTSAQTFVRGGNEYDQNSAIAATAGALVTTGVHLGLYALAGSPPAWPFVVAGAGIGAAMSLTGYELLVRDGN